jgi:hypothetical protein
MINGDGRSISKDKHKNEIRQSVLVQYPSKSSGFRLLLGIQVSELSTQISKLLSHRFHKALSLLILDGTSLNFS